MYDLRIGEREYLLHVPEPVYRILAGVRRLYTRLRPVLSELGAGRILSLIVFAAWTIWTGDAGRLAAVLLSFGGEFIGRAFGMLDV